MISKAVREFLQENTLGVLGTHRADRGVRQSVVYYALDGQRLLISTESKRGKTRDVIRERKESLCVVGRSAPYPSVTLEGPARVLTSGIGHATAMVMARILEQGTVEPPTEDDLAAADRVIIEIAVDRVYGANYLPQEP